MIDHRTDTALKWEGMDILIKNLGYVDAERFVALMNREPFDYTKWRQSNLEEDSVRNISNRAMQYVNDTYRETGDGSMSPQGV